MAVKRCGVWAAGLLILMVCGALVYWGRNNDTVPSVSFPTIDGREISTQELRGKVVLVNFWATTCPGCIAEMPRLIESYQRYHSRGFEIVAVAMSYDPPSQVVRYAQQNALPFVVALDPRGDLAVSFRQVRVTPTAFLVDGQGRIVRHVVGELDFAELHRYLDQTLSPG